MQELSKFLRNKEKYRFNRNLVFVEINFGFMHFLRVLTFFPASLYNWVGPYIVTKTYIRMSDIFDLSSLAGNSSSSKL